MNKLTLKYIIKKNSYKEDVIHACINDHKCSIRGCKIDLDNSNPLYKTFQFNYTKKYYDDGKFHNFYCIGYNWNSKLFKLIPNIDIFTIERNNRSNCVFTNLTEQFCIVYSI